MDPQEARIFIAVAIAAVLLGIILLFFALTMVRQQRRQMQLQRELLRTELDAIEAERARIAADLHDELAPRLSVVRFQVDFVNEQVQQAMTELTDASRSIDGLIDSMREIANNLLPIAFQRKGLAKAVEELAMKVNTNAGIDFQLQLNELQLLSEEKQIQIYRMVQEMLHNCLKHASASAVQLELGVDNGKFRLFYRDNGRGFSLSETETPANGIGLRSIRSRAEFLQGDLQVESRPGAGTAFLMEMAV
ncbi:MAG: sensor histidine kinase [Chitinophagaceae bacterium]